MPAGAQDHPLKTRTWSSATSKLTSTPRTVLRTPDCGVRTRWTRTRSAWCRIRQARRIRDKRRRSCREIRGYRRTARRFRPSTRIIHHHRRQIQYHRRHQRIQRPQPKRSRRTTAAGVRMVTPALAARTATAAVRMDSGTCHLSIPSIQSKKNGPREKRSKTNNAYQTLAAPTPPTAKTPDASRNSGSAAPLCRWRRNRRIKRRVPSRW